MLLPSCKKSLILSERWMDHKVQLLLKSAKVIFFFVLVFHVSADGGPWESPVGASEQPVAFPNSFI